MSVTNTQRLNDFVSACDEEGDMLQEAINELQIDISNLEKLVDYNVDDRTPVIRLTCMKLKLAAMNEYASVLSDIDHIAY